VNIAVGLEEEHIWERQNLRSVYRGYLMKKMMWRTGTVDQIERIVVVAVVERTVEGIVVVVDNSVVGRTVDSFADNSVERIAVVVVVVVVVVVGTVVVVVVVVVEGTVVERLVAVEIERLVVVEEIVVEKIVVAEEIVAEKIVVVEEIVVVVVAGGTVERLVVERKAVVVVVVVGGTEKLVVEEFVERELVAMKRWAGKEFAVREVETEIEKAEERVVEITVVAGE